jgi:N6-L-threonylcarbamoyladenine synthase
MNGHTDILAIESSCDETSAAVVRDGREVLSNEIYTQIAMHTVYGGVVPELASRKHIEKINTVVRKALLDAGKTLKDIDAVAVTYGPGLVGALLVGVAEAKAIAWAADKPLIGVNHIEGHISANYIKHPDLKPPYLGLVVSGGHTHLIIVKDWAEFEILGRTVDDAAGEAFDKVARAVGLGYPGGPKIDALVQKEGNPCAIAFPKAKVHGSAYDFSFSGIKSAVLNYINHAEMTGETINTADLSASFQKAVVDVLCEHTILAAGDYQIKEVAMAGGVSANSALRRAMEDACSSHGLSLYVPSPVYCTDNAAMIGVAAFHELEKGRLSSWDLNANPGLRLGMR